jgi:hypothetical protein
MRERVRLDEMCEDPLVRQQILDRVTHSTFLTGRYQEDVYGPY